MKTFDLVSKMSISINTSRKSWALTVQRRLELALKYVIGTSEKYVQSHLMLPHVRVCYEVYNTL